MVLAVYFLLFLCTLSHHNIFVIFKGVLVDSAEERRLDQGENLAIHCDPRGEEMTGAEAAYKWCVD